jgi:hypothetical protein
MSDLEVFKDIDTYYFLNFELFNLSKIFILIPFILYYYFETKYQSIEKNFADLRLKVEKVEKVEKENTTLQQKIENLTFTYYNKISELNLKLEEVVKENSSLQQKIIENVTLSYDDKISEINLKLEEVVKENSNLQQKIIENVTLSYDDKISEINLKLEKVNEKVKENTSLTYACDYKISQLKKNTNLLTKLIEFASSTAITSRETNVTLLDFIIKNPVDIYKYDKNIFCKMLAIHWDSMRAKGGPKGSTTRYIRDITKTLFDFFFFELSFEELDSILEKATNSIPINLTYSQKKFHKLHRFLEPFLEDFQLFLKNKTEDEKNIFLQKSYKIYKTTDCDNNDDFRRFNTTVDDWHKEVIVNLTQIFYKNF